MNRNCSKSIINHENHLTNQIQKTHLNCLKKKQQQTNKN